MTDRKWFWYGIVLILLAGCSECEDCDTEVSAPRTSFVFINQTSLNTLEPDLETVETQLAELVAEASLLNAQVFTLDSLLDSLTARIDRGVVSITQDSLDNLNTSIEQMTLDLATNTTEQTTLNTEKSNLESTIATIESGKILVDTVFNLATGTGIIFTDSATVYQLPLDPNFNEITYRFSIADQQYQLSLTYDLTTTLDARRKVRVLAENIQVVTGYTFSDVKLLPEEGNRTHDETTLQCSF